MTILAPTELALEKKNSSWLAMGRLSLSRLTPLYQIRNPVMMVVYCGALLTTIEALRLWGAQGETFFPAAVALCLWITVFFANFAETYAESRAHEQANRIKIARRDIIARKLKTPDNLKTSTLVLARDLEKDDLFLAQAGDLVPSDGQIVAGIATIDESAITGESAPVIRESGSDRDTVTGGTKVLSDWIVARVTANPGEGHLDRMISMLESIKRQKTPSETALNVFLSATTLAFLISCATLYFFSSFTAERIGARAHTLDIAPLIALLVCLAPTTIGGLLSAIGIAGMNRLLRANVLATSGRAVEAAGDVSVLLLDKTGTITLGNRQAIAFVPAAGIAMAELVEAALFASLNDETPEGKSIVAFAQKNFNATPEKPQAATAAVPFSAETRVSGAIIEGRVVLKGADDVILKHVEELGGTVPPDVQNQTRRIARQGGTPLLVSDGSRVLGIIHLKDVVKPGLKERLACLRAMGVKSVMITGDNPLTAAAIASEAGVDDFIAQAAPDTKLETIRSMQENGDVVAMVGDGTNDAPALAQADVALAMNTGTQAAKEASNMVDLDSDPTKLIEIVKIGKQLLMTRGTLTTFSLANDVAKYFTVMPAIFASTLPALGALDILRLSSPENGILAALIFNALVILVLLPVAFHGVPYRPESATRILRRHLLIYGLGGLALPFVSIKVIDALVFLIKESLT